VAVDPKNPEVDRLVRDLAAVTGEGVTMAVSVAVRERLERLRAVSKDTDVAHTDAVPAAPRPGCRWTCHLLTSRRRHPSRRPSARRRFGGWC